MSGISSSIGLISGIDYQTLIDNLIAADARPRDLLTTRMQGLDAQRAALLQVSARISALLGRTQALSSVNLFRGVKATSSLPDVMSVTASAGVTTGSYNFLVRSLASSQQLVTRGFQDSNSVLGSGTLTIESADARVDRSLRLDTLNGYTGVQRGRIRVTDSEGQSAAVDLTDAITLSDVLERINATDVGVRAEIRGDGLVLRDTLGGSQTMRVDEVSGGTTAAGLGFGPGRRLDADGDGELVGADLVYLSGDTPLTALNDGLGLRRNAAGGDFSLKVGADGQGIEIDLSDVLKPSTRLERLNHGRGVRLGTVRIQTHDGLQRDVDLSGAQSIQDVKLALESAFDDNRLSVTISNGELRISDNSEAAEGATSYNFTISDLSGHAAADLGITGSTSGSRIDGRTILHMDSLSDVLNAINFASNNEDPETREPLVRAEIAPDGRSIVLRSEVSGPLLLEIPENGGNAGTLADLGLTAGTYYDLGGGAVAEGQRVVGGLDTVLLRTLNGGQGFAGGVVQLSVGGNSTTVDLTGARTLADVVTALRTASDDAGLGLEVGYDRTGTRLQLAVSDPSAGDLTISDVSGSFAEQTGLLGTDSVIRSDNLQRKYLSETTALSKLNNGRGVSFGTLRITARNGVSQSITLRSGSAKTLGDVITAINETNIGVRARINATGDGILLEDQTTGTGELKVEDVGGVTARDLNLLGSSAAGSIDGSFEYQIDIGSSDTLASLAGRIGAETTLATATLLNDGGASPYRLSIGSLVGGSRGAIIVDTDGIDLGLATLTKAQDARVFFGSDASTGVLLTSATNTFSEVVPGLTFTANQVSDDTVTVNVDRNNEALLEALKGFVDDYNAIQDQFDSVATYDAETETAGVLFADSTVRLIESRLYKLVTSRGGGAGGVARLSDIGIRVENGKRLTFDEDRFLAAFNADPTGVTEFFTNATSGMAETLQTGLEAITDSDGLIDRHAKSLDDNKQRMADRVEQMNDLLDRKRARLQAQFQALESTLAGLQSQQNALASLASLAASTNLYSSSSSK